MIVSCDLPLVTPTFEGEYCPLVVGQRLKFQDQCRPLFALKKNLMRHMYNKKLVIQQQKCSNNKNSKNNKLIENERWVNAERSTIQVNLLSNQFYSRQCFLSNIQSKNQSKTLLQHLVF